MEASVLVSSFLLLLEYVVNVFQDSGCTRVDAQLRSWTTVFDPRRGVSVQLNNGELTAELRFCQQHRCCPSDTC